MMTQGPRIVAELGRPETPDETAARKAESSRVYRSSQTFRNLVAALIATLAIVLVVVLIVPRGEPAPRDPIDLAALAQEVSDAEGRTVVAPDLGADWIVTRAGIDGIDDVRAWTGILAEDDKRPDAGTGYLRFAQGFAADPAWPTRVLGGAGADGVILVDGIDWTRYDIADPSRADNIAVALSTAAGADTILLYGVVDDETLERAAASISDQVRALREESE